MALVYRVEHPSDGVGPYSYRWWGVTDLYQELCQHRHNNGRPGPTNDILGWNDWSCTGYRFGFLLLSDLRMWFDNCLRELRKYKFVVAVYEADDDNIMLGTMQVAFEYDSARRIGVISWEEVF